MKKNKMKLSDIIKTKKLCGMWSLSQLRKILSRLEKFDEKYEQYTCFSCSCGCLIFLFIVLAPVIYGGNRYVPEYLKYTIIVSLVMWALGYYFHKFDLSDDFRKFVSPLIESISQRIDETHPIYVDISFSKIKDDDNKTGEKKEKIQDYNYTERNYEREAVKLVLKMKNDYELCILCHEKLDLFQRTTYTTEKTHYEYFTHLFNVKIILTVGRLGQLKEENLNTLIMKLNNDKKDNFTESLREESFTYYDQTENGLQLITEYKEIIEKTFEQTLEARGLDSDETNQNKEYNQHVLESDKIFEKIKDLYKLLKG